MPRLRSTANCSDEPDRSHDDRSREAGTPAPIRPKGSRCEVAQDDQMLMTEQEPAAMYGIALNSRLTAWRVALKRAGALLSKTFCFSIHGSQEAALVYAQRWRDEMVKKHPPMTRRQRASTLRRNNKTGIVGVTCDVGADGQPVRWHARTYLGPGNVLTKAFSVRRWGAEAKQQAIAERQKQLRQMAGLARVHPGEPLVRSLQSQPLPPDLPVPIPKGKVVRRNNKSGIAGVSRNQSYEGDPGRWIARTYAGDGRYLRKLFSVKVHGEKKAKALAIAERRKQLEKVAKLTSRSAPTNQVGRRSDRISQTTSEPSALAPPPEVRE